MSIKQIGIQVCFLILLLNFNIGNAAYAQQNVSGIVTDGQSGETLPGVNISVKGTTTGTSTDSEGAYELTVPSLQDTLIFSFVGYQTQEIPISGRTEINVTLQVQAISGQEMVVVGYGTQKKSDLTGSIAQISPSVAEDISNTNVMQSLKGRVSGLHVGLTNTAGESPDIRIRGYNTLSTGASANKPLIVLDGSIYRGSIQDLNPDNIQSVNVLKGISATAVYGSQGSNGVIILTTKGGTKGISKPIFSYSTKLTRMTPNEHAMEPMNGKEWEQFFRDVHWKQSRIGPDYLKENPDYSIQSGLRTTNVSKGYANGADVDWYKRFTSNGYNMSHNLNLRGKSNDLEYFAAGSYTDEQGYRKNDKYEKYHLRTNLDYNITDWMSVATKSFLTSSSYPGIDPGNTFLIPPFARVRDEDGNYTLVTATRAQPNPYLRLQGVNSDKRLHLLGNANLKINLNFIKQLKGLRYLARYSYDYQSGNHDQFNPPVGGPFTGDGFKNNSLHRGWTFDNLIKYDREFNDAHSIKLTLLYGAERIKDESTSNHAYDFNSSILGYNKLELGDPSRNTINTGASGETSLYQMGRLNYTYNDKYLFTGTIRRDGYSGFGNNKKIGFFPSGAIGWIISREPFLRDKVKWLNYLKLRASYGASGRRAVGRYQTLANVSRGIDYIFGDGGQSVLGQQVTSLPNSNLSWEKTIGINVGIDFDLLNQRLSGNLSYYNNNTKNILYNIQIPYTTGFGSIPKNISKVHNNGIEFSLTGEIIRSEKFDWQTTFNFSRERTEIKKLLGSGDLVANRLFIDEPQRVVYDYKITGIWQLNDDIPDGFYPGTYKLADQNGDGEISQSQDMKILGYQDPGYRLSLSSTLNYKRWSFSFLINSIQGGKNYYYGDPSPYISSSWGKLDQLEYTNVPQGAWNYWLPENPNAKYRRLDTHSAYADNGNGAPAHPHMQRNFVRIRSVSLGYKVNEKFLNKLDIRNLRVFISSKNLFTFTKWPGWEPETATGFDPSGRPTMRSYTFGLNIKF